MTKPLGTGIINTAIKAGIASPEVTDTVTRLMATLNRRGAEVMEKYPVHACTDITGFGLLGHLAEMVDGSTLGIMIDSNRLPVIPGTGEYAKMGFIPGGAYKNREFRETMVEISSTVDRSLQDILFDPQTSGGLLIGIDDIHADALVGDLKNNRIDCPTVIGEVVSDPKGKIVVV